MTRNLEEEFKDILKKTSIYNYKIRLNAKRKDVKTVLNNIIIKNENVGIIGYLEDIETVEKYLSIDVKKYVIEKNTLCRDSSGTYTVNAKGFLENITSEKLDKLIIVSYDIRHILAMYLLNFDVKYVVIDLYDYLAVYTGVDLKRTVCFHKDIEYYKNIAKEIFFKIYDKRWTRNYSVISNTIKSLNTYDSYDALFVRQKLYERCDNKKIKEWYLVKIIDNCLEIKDFITAFRYMDMYIKKKYSAYEKMKRRKKLIEEYLLEITTLLSKRKQRDLLFFWIDAVSSKEREVLNLYQEEAETGILFENAYTHIPVTKETMYTMMSGMPYFENHVYEWKNVKDGKNYKWLIQKGYDLKEIGGGYASNDDTIVPARNPHSYYHPTPLVLWKTIIGLLSEENDNPKCYFIHCDCESHNPYWAGNMKKMVIGVRDPFVPLENYMSYIEEAEIYQQEQIRWYVNFLPTNACKVYMSDHGKEFPFWREEKIKTFIIINDLQLKSKKVKAPFSYLDFDKLLKFLAEPQNNSIENVYSDYILFQNDDPYEKMANEVLLHNDEKNPLYYREWMGFRGAIKGDKKIVIFRNGEKVVLDLNDNIINEDELSKSEIEELESLAGTYFGDMNSEHYKVVRRLYETLNIDCCM